MFLLALIFGGLLNLAVDTVHYRWYGKFMAGDLYEWNQGRAMLACQIFAFALFCLGPIGLVITGFMIGWAAKWFHEKIRSGEIRLYRIKLVKNESA